MELCCLPNILRKLDNVMLVSPSPIIFLLMTDVTHQLKICLVIALKCVKKKTVNIQCSQRMRES